MRFKRCLGLLARFPPPIKESELDQTRQLQNAICQIFLGQPKRNPSSCIGRGTKPGRPILPG